MGNRAIFCRVFTAEKFCEQKCLRFGGFPDILWITDLFTATCSPIGRKDKGNIFIPPVAANFLHAKTGSAAIANDWDLYPTAEIVPERDIRFKKIARPAVAEAIKRRKRRIAKLYKNRENTSKFPAFCIGTQKG